MDTKDINEPAMEPYNLQSRRVRRYSKQRLYNEIFEQKQSNEKKDLNQIVENIQ